MKLVSAILSALSLALLLSCSGGLGAKFQIDETYRADWDGHDGAETFSQYTVDALEVFGEILLDPSLKLENYKRFCPRYNELNQDERRRFWLMFISGLARLESNFDPNESYEESFTTGRSSSDNVVSKGLLQMSLDSVKSSYYKCDELAGINKPNDLFNPRKNLECAVIVMNRWVKADKKIYGYRWKKCSDGSNDCRTWYGVGRYWSPIRIERYQNRPLSSSESKKYDRLKALGEKTKKLELCGS